MKKKIEHILNSKDIHKYSSRGVKSILANLLLKILVDNNMSAIRCEELLTLYVRRTKNKGDVSKHFNKSTIKRELNNDQLTWDKFVRLLEVFRATKLNLYVSIEWASGATTIHSTGTIVISEANSNDVWEYNKNNNSSDAVKVDDNEKILTIIRKDINDVPK